MWRMRRGESEDVLRERLAEAPPVVCLEGGTVRAAALDDAWWIVRDEGTAVDLLDAVDPELASQAYRTERFDSREAWIAALAEVRTKANPSGIGAETAPGDPPSHRLPNERLTEADLPAPNAPWQQISAFAGTFNGYAEHGGTKPLQRFGRAMRELHQSGWILPHDVSALRSALFFEQRSDHFADTAEDPATLSYVHALVEALRSALERQVTAEEASTREDPVAACLPGAVDHLLEHSLREVAGDLTGLRERHLSAGVSASLGAVLDVNVASNRIPLADWPSLGKSGTDFVAAARPGPARFVGELKWCQRGDDKVYEAIWDLFKMALTLRRPGIERAYLVTGAPASMWPRSFCGDLFDGGTFTVEELCARRFARGSRRTAWDWLLEGGYDRYPLRMPAHITTTPVAEPAVVEAAGESWQVRAVAVSYTSGLPDVPFDEGWPHGWRPHDARRPIPPTAAP